MLRKIRNNTLKVFDDRSFIEQQKALTLFYISIAILILIPITLFYTTIVVKNTTPQVIIPHGVSFLSVLFILFVLKKGQYITAANLLISICLMSVWGVMFFDKLPMLYTINTISFIFGLMAMLPLIVLQKRYLILIYTVINFTFLVFFTFHIKYRFNLSSLDVYEYLIDNGLVMIFIAVVSYLVLLIYDKTLQQSDVSLTLAKYEAENNRELNRTLEARVEKRTEELKAALEEMEFMNDNLHHTNRQLEIAHGTMEKDMKMASTVQQKYLPQRAPESQKWQCDHYFSAMTGVSGDFFDYYFENENFKGLGLFDVSGHGVASGMVTMIARSIISRNLTYYGDRPLGEILMIINDELISEIGDLDYFMSGIILRIHKNHIEYCNAGHQPPMIYDSSANIIRDLEFDNDSFKGAPLGNIMLKGHYGEETFKIKKGDSLLLFTDGLFEALSPGGEEFGTERVHDTFQKVASQSATAIISEMKKSWENHVQDSSLRDDVTAILIKKI